MKVAQAIDARFISEAPIGLSYVMLTSNIKN